MGQKILISGYFGQNNFGDETILEAMVKDFSSLEQTSEITVISANPKKTSNEYIIKSIHKFDFLNILKNMFNTNIYVSGGGSIFQDITSSKSFYYYAFLLLLAFIFGKKTCIYAQGIGPINKVLNKKILFYLLKKVDLITVRDEKSQQLLENNKIQTYLSADNVWKMVFNNFHNAKEFVGINLRPSKYLDNSKIKAIADIIEKHFKNEKICLISMQDAQDLAVLEKLGIALVQKNIDTEIRKNLSKTEIFEIFDKCKFFIGMRFHACLIACKLAIPMVALSYDVKVEELAKDAGISFLDIKDISFENLDENISTVTQQTDEYIKNLKKYSEEKCKDASKNIDLFKKEFLR
ncbi:MAG: polysaccharide pyruvyl transferase CsaB [Candidatus Gastranaerophilales bacterium]|nr:polysaccharide pyruvyl transferase CsaB [Candidatus Gastranaerophilales bacterium]